MTSNSPFQETLLEIGHVSLPRAVRKAKQRNNTRARQMTRAANHEAGDKAGQWKNTEARQRKRAGIREREKLGIRPSASAHPIFALDSPSFLGYQPGVNVSVRLSVCPSVRLSRFYYAFDWAVGP